MSKFLHADMRINDLKQRNPANVTNQYYTSPLRAIELRFENVEGIFLNPKVIKFMTMNDVTNQFFLHNHSHPNDPTSLHVNKTANDVSIIFDRAMLFDINNHNVTHMHDCDKINLNDKKTIKDHMTLIRQHLTEHRDIVELQFIYEDDTQETIAVAWDPINDYVNNYAKVTETENKITVTINKDNAKQLIAVDYANTKNLVSCQWFEVANFLENNDIDDIYYIDHNDKDKQLYKLTEETKLTVAALPKYKWYLKNQ